MGAQQTHDPTPVSKPAGVRPTRTRRRYGAAPLAVVVGSGVAAAGFWVGVVGAPLPEAAGVSGAAPAPGAAGASGTARIAGMRHGQSGVGAMDAGGSMRHVPGSMTYGPVSHGRGSSGARLRSRGS